MEISNFNLSPNTGISQGDDRLQADMAEVVPDLDWDNIFAKAIESSVSSIREISTLSIQEINSPLNVDFYQYGFIPGIYQNDGEYYIGVSSFTNFEYEPVNGSKSFCNNVGTSSGDYNLTIDITNI